MDTASIANLMVQQQAALTSQTLGIAVQKSNADAQQAVVDLLTETTAAAPSAPSANSAITGRGQMLDISV